MNRIGKVNKKGAYTLDLPDRAGFDSEHLYFELIKVNPSLRDKMIHGLLWLNQNKINAVLIGGAAVVHYLSSGRPLTPDLDFLVEDLEGIKDLLDTQSIQYSPLVANGETIGITIDQFNLDLLDANTGNCTLNRYAMDSAITAMVASISLKIVLPEVLAIMKLEIGRDKDDHDAFLLLKSGKLNQQRYFESIHVLLSYLKQSIDIASYGNLI